MTVLTVVLLFYLCISDGRSSPVLSSDKSKKEQVSGGLGKPQNVNLVLRQAGDNMDPRSRKARDLQGFNLVPRSGLDIVATVRRAHENIDSEVLRRLSNPEDINLIPSGFHTTSSDKPKDQVSGRPGKHQDVNRLTTRVLRQASHSVEPKSRKVRDIQDFNLGLRSGLDDFAAIRRTHRKVDSKVSHVLGTIVQQEVNGIEDVENRANQGISTKSNNSSSKLKRHVQEPNAINDVSIESHFGKERLNKCEVEYKVTEVSNQKLKHYVSHNHKKQEQSRHKREKHMKIEKGNHGDKGELQVSLKRSPQQVDKILKKRQIEDEDESGEVTVAKHRHKHKGDVTYNNVNSSPHDVKKIRKKHKKSKKNIPANDVEYVCKITINKKVRKHRKKLKHKKSKQTTVVPNDIDTFDDYYAPRIIPGGLEEGYLRKSKKNISTNDEDVFKTTVKKKVKKIRKKTKSNSHRKLKHVSVTPREKSNGTETTVAVKAVSSSKFHNVTVTPAAKSSSMVPPTVVKSNSSRIFVSVNPEVKYNGSETTAAVKSDSLGKLTDIRSKI